MRALLAMALLCMLGGCWWQGPVFYPPDPARPGPLAPGLYTVVNAQETQQVRLLRTSDGSYVSEPRKPSDPPVTFVPLAFAGRELWISEIISRDPDKPGAAYGLLERRGAETDLLPLLMCDETEAIVRASGGTIDEADGVVTCRFEAQAALERALSAFASANPRLPKAAVLRRIGD